MPKFLELEKKVVQALKSANVRGMNHAEAISLQKKALQLTKQGKHDRAAAAYAGLATIIRSELDTPLRAARCYQKINADADASRWFLQSAERYALQDYPSRAIAILKLYHHLNPDDDRGPRHIYKLCRDKGYDRSTIVNLLSDKGRAGLKLRAGDLFAVFDDHIFDTMLERMKYRQLADRERLVPMGSEANTLFFVVRGAINGYLTSDQQQTHLGVVGEGGICGEVAYFTGSRHTAELIAKGRVELLELPYAVLDSLRQNFPAFNSHLEGLYKSSMLIRQLALTSVFANVDAQSRKRVAAKMGHLNIGAGQTLFEEGAPSTDIYLVRSGKLSINMTVDGSEHLLKTVETGTIIGEIAIAAGGRRTAAARTLSDCKLMKLSGSDYSIFYEQSPALKESIQKIKVRHIQEVRDMIKGINMVEGDDTCTLLLKDIWRD